MRMTKNVSSRLLLQFYIMRRLSHSLREFRFQDNYDCRGPLKPCSRDKHFEYCKDNEIVRMEMPEERSLVKFHDGQYQFKIPFVMYSDFKENLELIQATCPNPEKSYTKKINKHNLPSGFCVYSNASINLTGYHPPSPRLTAGPLIFSVKIPAPGTAFQCKTPAPGRKNETKSPTPHCKKSKS